MGEENIYIFGLRAEEIREMQQKGSYDPREHYENDAAIKEVLDALASDRFCPTSMGSSAGSSTSWCIAAIVTSISPTSPATSRRRRSSTENI